MITLTRGEAQNVLNLLILWLDEQEEPDTETAIETLRAKLSEPDQMTSSSIAQARVVAGLLRERNTRTWDDIDREAVFAIDALVSFASTLLNHRLNSVRAQPEPMIDGWPLYSGLPQPKEDQGLTTNPLPAIKLQEDWALGVGFKKAVPESWAQSAQVIGTQKKEWVGLTDDEMLDIYGQNHEGKKYNLGRLVQAKLKEKNT
jgi:hypothetical protein